MCALALALVLTAPISTAQTVVPVSGGTVFTETVSINSNEWRAYRISLASGDSVRIVIAVTLGGNIDIYTTDETGYAEYADPAASQFTYYPAGSKEITQSFPASFSPSASGTYYIVVDNAPISTSGAPGSSPVTVQVLLEKTTFPFLVLGLVFLVLAVVLILGIVLWLRASRRKRMAVPPLAPPGAPGPGPWPVVPPGEPGAFPPVPPMQPPGPPQPPTPP